MVDPQKRHRRGLLQWFAAMLRFLARPFRLTPKKRWLVYALKEPAIKQGYHVRLNGETKTFLAADEHLMLSELVKAVNQGGHGYYKVLYYADADNGQEVANFHRAVQRFKLQFRSQGVNFKI